MILLIALVEGTKEMDFFFKGKYIAIYINIRKTISGH